MPTESGPERMVREVRNQLVDSGLAPSLPLFHLQDRASTSVEPMVIDGETVPRYINEFWTSKQRQGSSLQEISYRACFKPQLPRFFIDLLSAPGQTVYDPFSGRGTTALEAGLAARPSISNDINPLTTIFTRPRFFLPDLTDLSRRLDRIPFQPHSKADLDLSMFYHPETESEIVSLKKYLTDRAAEGLEDDLDRWIRMAATNRLTGHSKGFFSVYTLPPNQAVKAEKQIEINKRLNQKPEYRDIKAIILKKSRSLLRSVSPVEKARLAHLGKKSLFLCRDARQTAEIKDHSIQLTVTSPPFLTVVQYADDNWLRCWFNDIQVDEIAPRITMKPGLPKWSKVMSEVFQELFRITRPGGWVAFEVGEVARGKIKLDEHVVPLGRKAGFDCAGIVINEQIFTKTSNIWGIKNNRGGTNTNRIVLLNKPSE